MQKCWLVLGPAKRIEVHRQPQGGRFAGQAVHWSGGMLTRERELGFTVELDRDFEAEQRLQELGWLTT